MSVISDLLLGFLSPTVPLGFRIDEYLIEISGKTFFFISKKMNISTIVQEIMLSLYRQTTLGNSSKIERKKNLLPSLCICCSFLVYEIEI